MQPHFKILIGFLTGAGLGGLGHVVLGGDHAVIANATALTEPVGKLFLRALLLCVIPLVASSLIIGVTGLGDLRKLGRVGAKTLALTVTLSSVSVIVGLLFANVFRPGDRIDDSVRTKLIAQYGGKAKEVATQAIAQDRSIGDAIVSVIPDNIFAAIAKSPPDMLGLMLFSLFFGVGLALQSESVKKPLVDVCEAVFRASSTMVSLIMKAAPIGVFCLLFTMTSRFGFDLLGSLAVYVVCVLAALLFQQVVVYGAVLKFLGRVSPVAFFIRSQRALLTAFSTSSSNATLPTALEVTEHRLQVPREISSFVLTVGATANQNGTALFEGITVLFLAQVFGVDLSVSQQAMVLVLAVVAGIGTAGVPSSSIPFIAIVLSQVGVPPEGIAIILGVDRLLDMCRTVLNVSGDMACAVVIARSEGADVMGEDVIGDEVRA